MAPRYALEVADWTLRDMINNNKPFGGKVFVLGGDFRQLLPVKVRGTRSETVNLSIKFCALWQHFFKYALTQNIRVCSTKSNSLSFYSTLEMGFSMTQMITLKFYYVV